MNKIKIYGVLGYPVKHSLSPFMHNAAFRALNLDAEYKLFEKKPEELEDFFGFFNKENIWGVNVTVPYKEKVLPFLNSLSQEVKLIGAVNTIKRVMDDKLEGYNTDGDGFIKHLRQDLLFEPKNKKVAILGAGGASKAISVYLSIARVKSITIFDIDKLKAEILVNSLKEHFRKTDFRLSTSVNGLNIKTSDLLVNATPIGMKDTEACLVNKELLHEGMLVYDLIYNPKETKLLKLAKDRGAQVSNGLGMLLYQGARSFELWTQKTAPIEIMRQALNDATS
ncbi:MAG: shikimate dehydrogenase [Candidatus Omnitrophota bacterium]